MYKGPVGGGRKSGSCWKQRDWFGAGNYDQRKDGH